MISIITPSYNQLDYLKRCCASVADQQVEHEHIVMDGGSTDGTVDWLAQQVGVKWISEPDRGMYDAINKGLAMARGDIAAYLNCDEQYLPGALERVAAWMDAHPGDSLVFGDALLVRPDGALAAYRKAYPLRWWYVASAHLYVLSCALFFRVGVASAIGGFDPFWKTCGDADFVMRALRTGVHAGHIRQYLGAFTMTGHNLGASAQALREMRTLWSRSPAWVRVLRPFLNVARRTEKILDGAYWQKWPLEYALVGTEGSRVNRVSGGTTFRWIG
jgi:glycosyltransferase involved in cell wall biosynthesis